ncbi:hypothetical protein [Streptantibioticus cattleyicolor]|uniref:Uncharacterized protein n=1 Tax=Streptantibioticus cattleyicolor (strain ATCC 35852 / DSM 46488 / JCM 4925 / NBRC 14057 / NRRL 8057) TaxID=1003195 RepID=F8JJX4_STREN|nr:hypothetical protein [Streptantibioticus cattleyicolor]AEW98594.1 hypothetical protein SCATT_p04010 [Streptantibioticus cattleyicolor NRRL 8057 = DSM 46488]CCB72346.1 conserved protein of unknown function [Streptantibioticus cattleyicolor NRRL 8057 = DSM 46488]
MVPDAGDMVAGGAFVVLGFAAAQAWRADRRQARADGPAAVRHRRRDLEAAADRAITAARRAVGEGHDRPAVTVADVQRRAAADLHLAVPRAQAAAALRERFRVRAGGCDLWTDA